MAHIKSTVFLIALPLISTLFTGCGGGGGGTNIVPETETIVSPVFDTAPFIPTPPYEPHQLAVNAPTAWEQGFSGQGTVIAVIDSGINLNHTDFIDRSGTRLIDDINATGFQFNTVDNTVYQVDDYSDTEGHGTYVSSIASGQEYGIAPSSAILPIKVFFDANPIDSRVIDAALPYAAQRSDVINTSISGMINPISIGINNSYDIYRSALSTNNVVLVTAAGNDAQPIGVQHFDLNAINRNLSIDPSLTNKVLNVISVDANGVRSTFSNTPG
ncbi:MAG: S8 family serine peptidase, partial [Thiomicrorhabdus sp.]|nr:S8 family serine peptidase [Thiomicrorhabdus sp.]